MCFHTVKNEIVKIQKDPRPRVTLESKGEGGRGDDDGIGNVLSQVNNLICSLLIHAHLKLLCTREREGAGCGEEEEL